MASRGPRAANGAPGAPSESDASLELSSQVLRTFLELHAVMRSHFVGTHEFSGIPSMPALRILERLINSPEPLGPSQLAQEMHLTRAAATQTLQVLERRGLIERLAHPTDGRMSGARITPEGVKRYRRFIPIVRYRQARACEVLSEAEQRRLLSMLQKMLDHSIELEFPNLGPPEP